MNDCRPVVIGTFVQAWSEHEVIVNTVVTTIAGVWEDDVWLVSATELLVEIAPEVSDDFSEE